MHYNTYQYCTRVYHISMLIYRVRITDTPAPVVTYSCELGFVLLKFLYFSRKGTLTKHPPFQSNVIVIHIIALKKQNNRYVPYKPVE